MQTSRPCPGCGTEWPCQDDEADGNDDANELGKDHVPSANRESSTSESKLN
jgi:non-structural maintenance of chromosomes element 1